MKRNKQSFSLKRLRIPDRKERETERERKRETDRESERASDNITTIKPQDRIG